MFKNKINLIAIILFFLTNNLQAISNFYIVTKVDNEIITNIDILQEANYLISLNNDLKKIDRKSLISLAKSSLIREKIKKIEINKNNISLDVNEGVLENLIQKHYEKLQLNNIQINNYCICSFTIF